MKIVLYIVYSITAIGLLLGYSLTVSEYVGQEYLSWYNWVITCFWIIFSIIISYRLSDFLIQGATSASSNKKLLLYTLLLGALFHLIYLINMTSDNMIKIWHTYYFVRGIELVSQYGTTEALNGIRSFDNFLSGPGLPVMGSILSFLTGLTPEHIASYFGLSALILCILGSYLVMRKLFNDNITDLALLYTIMISVGAVNFLYATFNYAITNLSFLMLMTFTLLTFSESNSQGKVVIIAIFVISSLVYYLPGTLIFSLLIFISVLLTRALYARSLRLKSLFFASLITLTLSLAYLVYYGFAFYGDFYAYLSTILQGFKLEPFIVYTEARTMTLDPLMRFLLYTSRLSILRFLAFLLGSLYCFIFMKERSWFAMAGIFLTILSGSSIFIHGITDYTLRFNIYLYVFSSALLIAFLSMLRKILELDILNRLHRGNVLKYLKVFVTTLILFSLLFGIISSWLFSYILVPVSPKSASDSHYYMRETYELANFIGTHIDLNTTIIGNYRYGFVKSIYDLNFIELSDYFINSIEQYREPQWILVLSALSKEAPDRGCSIVPDRVYKLLDRNFNKIYDSSLSFVYENNGSLLTGVLP